jgi:putative glycosyltransferase (TIGR04348 family)
MLRRLNHRVELAESFIDQPCETMIALHARKSFPSIRRFHALRPGAPLVVALTGTDLYADLPHSANARRSLEWADLVITLQPDAIEHLPPALRPKARAILQSAAPPRVRPRPLGRLFEVTVLGHMRSVKDPFRTAIASRRLPASSRIRVIQIGRALTTQMRRQAQAEMRINPRYRWLGELPRWKALRRLARSRLTVVSSRLEGGPNVVSEALVAGVPVLSSRISGVIGMLGADYPGYFPVGDTQSLAELLVRAETDAEFYARLAARCRKTAINFDPKRELETWAQITTDIERLATRTKS